MALSKRVKGQQILTDMARKGTRETKTKQVQTIYLVRDFLSEYFNIKIDLVTGASECIFTCTRATNLSDKRGWGIKPNLKLKVLYEIVLYLLINQFYHLDTYNVTARNEAMLN